MSSECSPTHFCHIKNLGGLFLLKSSKDPIFLVHEIFQQVQIKTVSAHVRSLFFSAEKYQILLVNQVEKSYKPREYQLEIILESKHWE